MNFFSSFSYSGTVTNLIQATFERAIASRTVIFPSISIFFILRNFRTFCMFGIVFKNFRLFVIFDYKKKLMQKIFIAFSFQFWKNLIKSAERLAAWLNKEILILLKSPLNVLYISIYYSHYHATQAHTAFLIACYCANNNAFALGQIFIEIKNYCRFCLY